jgi:hypothetical protein
MRPQYRSLNFKDSKTQVWSQPNQKKRILQQKSVKQDEKKVMLQMALSPGAHI